jgi:hypothetical protein
VETKISVMLPFSSPRVVVTPVPMLKELLRMRFTSDVCIVGDGVSSASTAFFLTNYTTCHALHLRVFERRPRVSSCFTTITIAGDRFEAGGSITPATSTLDTSPTS